MNRNDFAGLLVIADGAVVHETYRLGIDSESRFHLWSATKGFTSTVLGRALYEGVIDSLDHRVDRFVKLNGAGYGGATLRHLLMMSSGVNFFHFKGSPDRAEMYRQIWGATATSTTLWASAARDRLQLPRDRHPRSVDGAAGRL